LRCLPCYVVEDKNKFEISTEEVLRILEQLKGLGTLEVVFTGGEIFLRKDILEILSFAKRMGLQARLFTNGTIVTEEMIDRLIKLGINKFEISFFGAREKTFDKITQVDGSYKKVLTNIKLLKQKRAHVSIKALILNENLNEFKEMIEIAKGLRVYFTYSTLILPKACGAREVVRHQIPPRDFIRLTKETIVKNQASYLENRKPKRKDRLFYCLAGESFFCINPYGRMNVCVGFSLPGYDILKRGVNECWEELKKFVDETKGPLDWKCGGCEFWDYCTSCPVWAYLYTGSLTGCPGYFKELARLSKEKEETKTKLCVPKI
jgi:radical SAM protein with 4Fe4S-binding SPASM domain